MYTNIVIVFTRLNGFNYFYLTLIILFKINYFLQTVKKLQVSLFNTNYSIQNYSVICAQLNNYKYCYVSLQIKLDSLLFKYS